MAEPANSPNQAASGPTPSNAPTGSENPLAGTAFAQLGQYIAELAANANAGSMSTKRLNQEQANLIDHHQSLVDIANKEAVTVHTLERKIKELNATVKSGADREAPAYKTALAALNGGLAEATIKAEQANNAARLVADALDRVVIGKEKQEKADKAIHTAEEKQITLSKVLEAQSVKVGGAMHKAAGPMGELGSVVASFATKVPGVSKVFSFLGGPWVSALLLGGSVLSQVFKLATRETTTFANTFGTSLGFAIDQQNAFKHAIDGTAQASINITKIQDIGSAAMKAGAFDAYTANMMVGRGYKTQEAASMALAASLGQASTTMARMGIVLNMSEAESGKLLGTFVTTMGAFDAAIPGANMGLNNTINRFGQLNKMTGSAIPTLISMISGISEATLPMGISFDTITAQTGLAMQALAEYGKTAKLSGDLFLASSGGMERMTKALYQYGASISAEQTYGFDLVSGIADGLHPISGVLDAIQKTPLERLSSQITASKKMGLDTDTTVMMMRQKGLKDEYVKTMRGILGDPKAAAAFDVAAKAKDRGSVEAAFSSFAPDMQKTMADMATQMQFTRDPMDQLVTLTTNMLSQLTYIASFVGKMPFMSGTPVNAPLSGDAKAALAKSIPMNGSDVFH